MDLKSTAMWTLTQHNCIIQALREKVGVETKWLKPDLLPMEQEVVPFVAAVGG